MTIRIGDTVRTISIRSPSMLVINVRFQNEDTEFADLLWFDASMNARQLTLDIALLEPVPYQHDGLV